MRRIDDLIELINNIVDVEQKKIDDKEIEFEKFETLLASKICDVTEFWLIEMKTRMSNSNWLQEFLFWTNRIQLSQRLKFDWSIRREQRRYFYLYVVQVFFRFSLCFFVKVWFSCCIATFRFKQRLFFKSIEMTSLNV